MCIDGFQKLQNIPWNLPINVTCLYGDVNMPRKDLKKTSAITTVWLFTWRE
jgi:hypothetical protein